MGQSPVLKESGKAAFPGEKVITEESPADFERDDEVSSIHLNSGVNGSYLREELNSKKDSRNLNSQRDNHIQGLSRLNHHVLIE